MMTNDKQQDSNGREERIRSGLKWIGSQVRDVKFGRIRGVLLRDGVLMKGPRYRVTHTGKPRGRGSSGNHDALEGDNVLLDALHDLRRDTARRGGEWEIEFKVHKGIPVSWEMEESGHSAGHRAEEADIAEALANLPDDLRQLADALDASNGNLIEAAQAFGLSHKKARIMRMRLQRAIGWLRNRDI